MEFAEIFNALGNAYSSPVAMAAFIVAAIEFLKRNYVGALLKGRRAILGSAVLTVAMLGYGVVRGYMPFDLQLIEFGVQSFLGAVGGYASLKKFFSAASSTVQVPAGDTGKSIPPSQAR